MKAEHRKELQTNYLADQIGQFVRGVRQDSGTWVVLGFVAVALALLIAWRYFSNVTFQKRSELWTKLEAASSVDALESLAQQNPGTLPARIAQFELARTQLRGGLAKLAASSDKEREEAQAKLKEAGELYAKLAQDREFPLLAQEALRGAGKALESQGDLDGALKKYDELVKAYPDSPLAKQTAEYAKQLADNREQVQKFYDELKQLAAAKPKTEPKP
jgi:tetratricopeptide (TPR) repeat protein